MYKRQRQHFLDGWHQRARFPGVAGEDLMMNRQAFGRLDHPEHHLTRDTAFLRQAEVTDVSGQVGATFATDRRQVLEDNRQFLIDQGAQQPRQGIVHRVGARRHCIHGAQKLSLIHI